EDVWVEFRDDTFRVLDGTRAPIPGATGAIQLGTAGCPVDTSIPDEFENRKTTDIEIRIDRWSQLDPVPESFAVSAFAGAVFSGAPVDFVGTIVVDLEDPVLSGDVNRQGVFGGAASVLRVNGSAGDCIGRRVPLASGEPITLSLDPSPAGPANAHYVV